MSLTGAAQASSAYTIILRNDHCCLSFVLCCIGVSSLEQIEHRIVNSFSFMRTIVHLSRCFQHPSDLCCSLQIQPRADHCPAQSNCQRQDDNTINDIFVGFSSKKDCAPNSSVRSRAVAGPAERQTAAGWWRVLQSKTLTVKSKLAHSSPAIWKKVLQEHPCRWQTPGTVLCHSQSSLFELEDNINRDDGKSGKKGRPSESQRS